MLHFKKTILLSLAIISVFSLSSYTYAVWNDPTATPPGNNTPTPINVGTTDQVKTGNLGIGAITTPGAKLDVLGRIKSRADKPFIMTTSADQVQFEWQFLSDQLRFNKTGLGGNVGDILNFDFLGNVGVGGVPAVNTKFTVNGPTSVYSGTFSVFGPAYMNGPLGISTSATKKLDVMVSSNSDGIRLRRSDNNTGFSLNAGGWSPWIDYVGVSGHSDLWFVPKASYSNLGVWQSTTTAPASFRISGLGTASYVGARSYCDIDGANCFTADEVGGGGGNFWALSGNGIYNTNTNRNVGIGTNAPLSNVGGTSQTVLEVNGATNSDGHAALAIRAKAGANPRLFFGTGASSSDTSNKPTWVIYQRNGSSGQLSFARNTNGYIALEISNTDVPITTVNGGFKLTAGSPALNKILASDATGLASWKAVSEIPGLGGGGSYSELNWATSTSNPNLMFNKNQTSGATVVIGATTQAVSGSKFEVNGLSIFKGILGLSGTNAVEFGQGVVGKQADAGKIMYKRYSNGLDIIGAGEAGVARIVKIWDSLVVDTIFATNICSNTTGACNSVTNIIGGNLWVKDGTDIKLSGNPNDTVNVFNSKVNTFTVNNIDNYFKQSGTSSFTLNQGGVVRLTVGNKVSINSNTDFHVGLAGQPGKFVYGGNGASTGKVLVAKDDVGTVEWQNLPILTARFTKDSCEGIGCGNSNFTRVDGSPLITYTVRELNGTGGKDFLDMACPAGYVALGGGARCNPGNYLEESSRNVNTIHWTVSCGTELAKIQDASITCAKIQ